MAMLQLPRRARPRLWDFRYNRGAAFRTVLHHERGRSWDGPEDARSIVEAHGGKVAAENADGGGARFYFHLPRSEKVPQ